MKEVENMLNKAELEILKRMEKRIDELGMDDKRMSKKRKLLSVGCLMKKMSLSDEWMKDIEGIDGVKLEGNKEFEEAMKLLVCRKTGIEELILEDDRYTLTDAVMEVFSFGQYKKGNNSKPTKPVEQKELTKGEEITNFIILIIGFITLIGVCIWSFQDLMMF
jgi:hypothetical protein